MPKTRPNRKQDPFNLDHTEFAEALRRRNDDPLLDHPDEPEHPLRSDALVVGIVRSLETFQRNLLSERMIGDRMASDSYFEFDEGLMLRPEVIVRAIIEIVAKKDRDYRRRVRQAGAGNGQV